jgi:hypothetical protein
MRKKVKRLTVHGHLQKLDRHLAANARLLKAVLQQGARMAGELEAAVARIEANVTPINDGVTAVKTLIVQLMQAVKDAVAAGGSSPELVARVNAVADAGATSAADLAAAALSGTPAAPQA